MPSFCFPLSLAFGKIGSERRNLGVLPERMACGQNTARFTWIESYTKSIHVLISGIPPKIRRFRWRQEEVQMPAPCWWQEGRTEREEREVYWFTPVTHCCWYFPCELLNTGSCRQQFPRIGDVWDQTWNGSESVPRMLPVKEQWWRGEPAARCATKDESPLTSVRGRGHSSHLVCRTSGFLLLRPPPPSPSRLHGGFLLLPLQKATGPEWRAKRWQLECFLALSFTLTLILLQCNPLYLLLPMSTPCLPFSPHTSSAIQLLPLFFFLFFKIYNLPHPLSPQYGSFASFPPL